MLRAFLVLLLFSATIVHADEYSGNIRELCRAEVGGALINGKNRVDMLVQNAEVWRQKLRNLQREQQRLEKEIVPVRKKTQGAEFNRDAEDSLEALTFRLRVIVSQIDLGKSTLAKIEPEAVQAEVWLAKFRELIKPVFKTKVLKSSHAGAYNFSVAYHHKCGKYQYLCPLPQKSRPKLEKISEALESPKPCKRYAKVVSPNNN